MHLLPVTKVQFELFLAVGSNFSNALYKTILQDNPRSSFRHITKDNYWQLFITNILVEEAEQFARFVGPNYRLPSEDEWQKMYAYCAGVPRVATPPNITQWTESARLIWESVNKYQPLSPLKQTRNQQTHFSDQCLLEYGVMEWCTPLKTTRYEAGGMGAVDHNLSQTIHIATDQARPIKPLTQRLTAFGLRLIRSVS